MGWDDPSTLGETIYYLVEEKKTQEKEFQAILLFYGRDKVKKLYLEEREKRRATT